MRTIWVVLCIAAVAVVYADPFFDVQPGLLHYEGILQGRLNDTNIGIINELRLWRAFSWNVPKGASRSGADLLFGHSFFLGYTDFAIRAGLNLPYLRIEEDFTFRMGYNIFAFGFLQTNTFDASMPARDTLRQSETTRIMFVSRSSVQLGGMIGPIGISTLLRFNLYDAKLCAPDDAAPFFYLPPYGAVARLFDMSLLNNTFVFYNITDKIRIGIENTFFYVIGSSMYSELISGLLQYHFYVNPQFSILFKSKFGYYIINPSFSKKVFLEIGIVFQTDFFVEMLR